MSLDTGMANPLHWEAADSDVLWSPGNVSEAIPSVSTALNWSFVGDAVELASRRAFRSIGVLRASEVMLPNRAEDRFMVCFYGRTVANIEAMRLVGNRMPGTSANAIEEQLFGVVRPDAVDANTASRIPAVAVRMPRAAMSLRRDQAHLREQVVREWRQAVLNPPADLDAARELLASARELYTRSFELGVFSTMLATSLYEQVAALAKASGRPELEHRLVTGYANLLESRLLSDMWTTARGDMNLAAFQLRHGYHGPDEGQLAGWVWREHPAPLQSLLARFAALDDQGDPSVSQRRQVATREAAEAEVLANLGRLRRPGARALLRLAQALIPQREIGKANYTQSLDIARIAARVAGRELVEADRLDSPDDVFSLILDEVISAPKSADLRSLAIERQKLRADYLTTDLPGRWTGRPMRVPLDEEGSSDDDADRDLLSGEGAGGGAVVARARVVTDPEFDDLEHGEILVCRSTDPGWVSLFHLAGGVVIDLGGQMSHGAIVARELGLPCVTCTVDGTRRIKTGDLLRVNGDNGTVQIVERSTA